MAEYIEREAMMEVVEKSKFDNCHDNPRTRMAHKHEHEHFLNLIMRQPAADVVEVVHGKWEDASDLDGVVCSVCGEDFCVLTNENERFKYCPNCGARMDGE